MAKAIKNTEECHVALLCFALCRAETILYALKNPLLFIKYLDKMVLNKIVYDRSQKMPLYKICRYSEAVFFPPEVFLKNFLPQ
jgi:hypothetical protein